MGRRSGWMTLGSGKSYFHRVHRPLQVLIFLLPFLIFYQIATSFHPWSGQHDVPPNVVAFVLLLKFFNLVGATAASYLPTILVVVVLLIWHIAKKDPWELEPPLYLGMALESLVWAAPLLVLGALLIQKLNSMQAGPPAMTWQTEAMLSVGAGVYEELLFRLIAMTLLDLVLVDLMEVRLSVAIPLTLIISATLFSLYHYLGAEDPAWTTFFFRSAAGLYFGGIFLFRGFGIVVGCHAAYDLILVIARHWG